MSLLERIRMRLDAESLTHEIGTLDDRSPREMAYESSETILLPLQLPSRQESRLSPSRKFPQSIRSMIPVRSMIRNAEGALRYHPSLW